MGELFRLERAPQPLEFTGERLTSNSCGQIEIEHLHRYFIGREICRRKDVLDIASGEGYGSAILAQVARRVVGVELDAKSVAHASSSYSRQNLCFVQGDARSFPLADASFDVVVSFETFEHFAEQNDFLREVKRVLKPGGILLISTPDRDVYSPAGTPANPYHVRELTRDEFRTALNDVFSEVVVYTQRAFAGSVIAPYARNAGAGAVLSFEKRDATHIEIGCGLPRAPYLIALASDQQLQEPAYTSLYISKGGVGTEQAAIYDDPRQTAGIQKTVSVQVYPFVNGGYSEDTSVQQRTLCDSWQTVTLELPDGTEKGPLRIDPADCPCVVQIGRLVIQSAHSGDVLWMAESPAALRSLEPAGSSALLPNENGCFLVSFGTDPQLKLPAINTPIKPLRLQALLHVSAAPEAVFKAIDAHTKAIEAEVQRCRNELNSSYTERILVAAELKRVAGDRNEARRELMQATDTIQSLQAKKSEEEAARKRLESEVNGLKARLRPCLDTQQAARNSIDALTIKLASLEQSLAAERQIRAGLEHSVSWRITRPARSFMRLLRSGLHK